MRRLARFCAAALLVQSPLSGTAVAQSAHSSTASSASIQARVDTLGAAESRFGAVPHKFVINLGGYLPFIGTHAKFSTQLRNGTNINLENVLGLSPNTQTFNAGASWRISKHNFLGLNYFTFSRSATKQISDSIVWGGNVYHPGATMSLTNQFGYYGISYRYYIWRERIWELGPGLGIDGLYVSTDMGVRLPNAGGGGGFADSARARGKVTVPVPLLGVYGDWEFVPRVFATGAFQYIYVNNIANYGGHVGDGTLGLEWYPFNHWGVGAVYHYVGIEVSKTSSRTGNSVHFNYSIQGPALYLSATF